jgi:putative DNA primase/helicase
VRLDALIDRVKGFIEISATKFDTNPLIVNCENGTYDIPSGEFRLGHDPEDYCMLVTGPYIKHKKNEKWDTFKEKVQPSENVRAFLKRALGYSATASTSEEAAFYIYGPPRSGKSTFIEAARSALGTYGKAESFSTFLMKGDGSDVRPRPEILRLRGSRLTRSIETNKNMRWDAALLNTLVSGEPYTARALFSNDPVEVAATFKIWVVSNHRVKADYDPEEEGGFWRRLYPIPFDVVIPDDERDISLKSYFMNDPDAKAAILAEILEGATEWYQVSKGGTCPGLNAPDEIISARYEYKAAQSPIYEFLKNECIIGKDYRVPVGDLWDAFSDIRKGYNTNKVKSVSSLGRYLKGLGFDRDKINNVRYAFGLRLLGLDEEPDESFSLCTLVHLEGQKNTRPYGLPYHEGQAKKEGSKCTSVQEQTQLAQHIQEILLAAKNAGILAEDKEQLAQATAIRIKQQHAEWREYDVLGFYKKLAENDHGIQGLIADVSGGPTHR